MRGEQNLCLLPQTDNQMYTPALETSADLAIALLIHYSFDLSGYSASELVDHWEKQYPGNWLHLAVIEALYQGRYKAVSVQQILTCWQRRGQALFHFNMEFERLICSKFPQSLTSFPTLPPPPVQNVELGQERPKDKPKVTRSQCITHRSGEEEPALREGFPPGEEPYPKSYEHATLSNTQRYRTRNAIEHATLSSTQRERRVSSIEATSVQKSKESSVSIDPDPHFGGTSSSPSPQVATNNPPIEQFTPEKRTNSDSFTSKLQAISGEKRLSFRS